MTVLGPGGLYLYTATIHGLLAIYILLVSLRRKAVTPDQTGDFSEALTTAYTSSQVYEEEQYIQSEESL